LLYLRIGSRCCATAARSSPCTAGPPTSPCGPRGWQRPPRALTSATPLGNT